MTSSPRRSRHGLRRRWRRRIVAGAIGLFGLAVVAIGLRGLLPERGDRAAAERALWTALTRLEGGNLSGARAAAGQAVTADPAWGLAHAVLARSQLAVDDGAGASASLDRAKAAGFDMRRVSQLRARALLLGGDIAGARRALNASDPRFRAYNELVRAELALRSGDYRAALATLDAAVAARPGDAAAWTALARTRRAAADLRGAIVASERAVAIDPRSTQALLLRGQLVRDQYGLVAALPWFESAIARDPGNHDALIEYAATLGEVGRTRHMLAAARRATQVRGGSPQALYLQATLAARAGKFDLARDILDHMNGAMDDVPGVMLLKGALDLRQGDEEQAILRLRELLARQPMNLSARRLLAAAYARSDASRNAITALTPILRRSDADGYSLTLAARAFERIGDRVRAAPLLDRAAFPARGPAAAFAPDDGLSTLRNDATRAGAGPIAEIGLIRGLIATGDAVAALDRARIVAAANPGVPAAQMLLGDAWMLANRPTNAIDPYTRAVQMRFDEPTTLKLVEALDRAGRRADAARTLTLFLSQNPGNIAALRLSANWQIAGGEDAAAIVTLEELRLRLGDRDAALLAALALANVGAGDGARALEYGTAAYALQPQNPAVADAYGVALLANGDRTGARDLLRKAVSLAPGNAGIAAHLRDAATP